MITQPVIWTSCLVLSNYIVIYININNIKIIYVAHDEIKSLDHCAMS